MSDWKSRAQASDWKSRAEPVDAEGEAGNPSPDIYAGGPNAHQQPSGERTLPTGSPIDAAISWADTAALGGGPQIAGAIGAVAHAATDPMGINGSDADAYKFVRDQARNRIDKAEDTKFGAGAKPLGMLSTPGIPAPVAGASIPARAWQAAKVGGTLGGLHAAFTSKADLTKADIDNLKQFLADTGGGVVGGGVVSGALGAGLAATEAPLRATAEEQALRAAGLRAGIKNSVQKDLGVADMDEARKVGRSFLDEGLIPRVGSSEAVAKNAEALRGQAGRGIDAALATAQATGSKASEVDAANAARRVLMMQSAPAVDMAGQKAKTFADSMERQGELTPGSFRGLNDAKSDAWKLANFDAEAPLAPVLYRKAVGATRNDIERQVGAAAGPDVAANLAKSNQQYGTAMDALKLARNESTREAAKSGIGPMKEALALLSGTVAGGAAGHPVAGAGMGLAGSLGLKAYDKYGHSSAARLADFLAEPSNKLATGVGGRLGSEAWSRFLKKDEDHGDE